MRNWFVSHMVINMDGTKGLEYRMEFERHEILGEFRTRQQAYLFAQKLEKGSLTGSDENHCEWEKVIDDEGYPAYYKVDVIRLMRLE